MSNDEISRKIRTFTPSGLGPNGQSPWTFTIGNVVCHNVPRAVKVLAAAVDVDVEYIDDDADAEDEDDDADADDDDDEDAEDAEDAEEWYVRRPRHRRPSQERAEQDPIAQILRATQKLGNDRKRLREEVVRLETDSGAVARKAAADLAAKNAELAAKHAELVAKNAELAAKASELRAAKSLVATCNVCMEPMLVARDAVVLQCGHRSTCKTCLVEHARSQLQDHPTCTVIGCRAEMNVDDMQRLGVLQDFITVQRRISPNTFPCCGAGCQSTISKMDHVATGGMRLSTCHECKLAHCTRCQTTVTAHAGAGKAACLGLMRRGPESEVVGAAATAAANADQTHNWPCPECGTMVDKTDGCNSMHCNCGAFFCWNCGNLTVSADDREANNLRSTMSHAHFWEDDDLAMMHIPEPLRRLAIERRNPACVGRQGTAVARPGEAGDARRVADQNAKILRLMRRKYGADEVAQAQADA